MLTSISDNFLYMRNINGDLKVTAKSLKGILSFNNLYIKYFWRPFLVHITKIKFKFLRGRKLTSAFKKDNQFLHGFG